MQFERRTEASALGRASSDPTAAAHRGEGPNERSRFGSKRSMSEKDAVQKAEKPERSRKVGGGTAEGTTPARQALTARGEEPKPRLRRSWRRCCAERT